MKLQEIILTFAVCTVASTVLAVLMWAVVLGAALTWAPIAISVPAGLLVTLIVRGSSRS